MDGYRLAIGAFRVVDPGFHIAAGCLGGPAFFIEGILDPSWSGCSIGGTREGVLFLSPAASISADETKTYSVVIWIGIVDLEVDEHALRERLHVGDLRGRWWWRGCRRGVCWWRTDGR